LPLSAIDSIGPAFQHTKKQIFQPFRFWQWTRLALVGLVAGELGSSGGCNVPTSFPTSPNRSGGSDKFMDAGMWQKIPELWHGHSALMAGLITAFLVLMVVLWLLAFYLNSRMRFVLFDSVVMKHCHIREYWSRRRTPAFRYFVWQLLFSLCSFVVLVILIGIPMGIAWLAGWMQDPGKHVGALLLGGIPVFFLLMAVFICAIVIQVMTKDFVVPFMAIEGVTALQGWRRLWPAIKGEKGGYAGYVGMKVVLAIAAGIIFGIIGLIVGVIIAIPAVIIGVAIGVASTSSAVTWNAVTITLAVVAGCIFLAVLFYTIALISVPVAVFFPAYSYHFLASRYPRLDALLHPPLPSTPPPPVFEVPRLEPPPLPPEPSAI
jgi:hypothetical protein